MHNARSDFEASGEARRQAGTPTSRDDRNMASTVHPAERTRIL
jgi:hypothetical protein